MEGLPPGQRRFDQLQREFLRRPGGEECHLQVRMVPFSVETSLCFRRAYGWTVDEKQRVFIEGDVRVDIYHESPVGKEKVVNIYKCKFK